MYETIGMLIFFGVLALIAWASGTDWTYRGHVGPSSIFRIGDTVQLKSGGPRMLVTAIDNGTEQVLCKWIGDGTCALRAEFFPAADLIVILK